VGRLVAFVDMKVDELWKNDTPFSKSTLATAAMPLWCTTGKSRLTTEPGKRATKSLWCSKARPDIESEMLGGLTRTKYHHSRHFYCCRGVRLDLEATLTLLVSVYDTSLPIVELQRRIELANASSQVQASNSSASNKASNDSDAKFAASTTANTQQQQQPQQEEGAIFAISARHAAGTVTLLGQV
jgi:hypothetical protein